MILLIAALLVTDPVVSQPYTTPPADLFGMTTKTIALTRTDAGAVACWTNQPQVLCAALRAAGGFDEPVALASLQPGASDAVPAVAWNGSELLVAYEELGPPNRIVLARLDRNLRPVGSPVRLMYASGTGPAPSLSWNGSEWLLTQRIFATRLTPELDVIENLTAESSVIEGAASGNRSVFLNSPLTRTVAGPCTAIPLTYGNLVLPPPPCTPTTIVSNEWTATLLSFGNVALPLSQQPIAQNATVASRARGALFVWPAVESASTFAIIATALEGERLGTSYEVATASEPVAPRVAATENSALVVWEEHGDVRGVMLHADGTAEGEPFVIAATAQQESHPNALALSDGEYVVVYELEGRLATRFVLQLQRRRSR